MTSNLRLLLFPFSLIYGVIIRVRNWLFDIGFLKSISFDVPVICVGNLAVGGSGKTPVTEYLVSILTGNKIAILSRGYGRSTKGFLLADDMSTANTIGDEPLQYYHKFGKLITVAVCEDRVNGINLLKDTHDLIILDDAFQHRWVKPGLSILLFEFSKLLKSKFLLPAGDLREPFYNYKRADIILVTKSPSLDEQKRVKIKDKFLGMKDDVYFTSIQYKSLVSLYGNHEVVDLQYIDSLHLLTGIANPDPLLQYLNNKSFKVHHHEYPDHHQFTKRNIGNLISDFKSDQSQRKIILTTEKDSQRLLDAAIKELLLDFPVFYLPIEIVPDRHSKDSFDQMIINYVSSTTRNR
ncbi:tetraacyldisaccharide 4'-kinase [Pedobacter sp. PWIIR3]